MTGKEWYKEYLLSEHWQRTKKRVLRKRPYVCSMPWCGKHRNLQFHHIDYSHLETEEEIADLFILCGAHHWLCHNRLLGLIKVPLKRRDLLKRYRYLYVSTWRRFRPSWFFDWIYDTYKI